MPVQGRAHGLTGSPSKPSKHESRADGPRTVQGSREHGSPAHGSPSRPSKHEGTAHGLLATSWTGPKHEGPISVPVQGRAHENRWTGALIHL